MAPPCYRDLAPDKLCSLPAVNKHNQIMGILAKTLIKYQTLTFFQGMLCEMPEKCPLVAKCECNDLFYEKHKMVLCWQGECCSGSRGQLMTGECEMCRTLYVCT